MARTFLTNLNLEQNQLLKAVIQNATQDPLSGVAGQVYYNTASDTLKVYSGSASAWVAVGSVEFIGDSVAELLRAGTGISLNYNDAGNTLTITNTGITSVTGTNGNISATTASGAVTLNLSTVNPTGSGTGGWNGTTNTITTPIVNVDSYGRVTSITSASTHVVTHIDGTENEIEVSAGDGSITIGLPDDVTIGGNLVVTGDFTVNGDVTTINTATLEVEDNKVLLNKGVVGTPTLDAGIEVERGDLANSSLYWDEALDKWVANSGSATYAISLEGHTHVASDITNLNSSLISSGFTRKFTQVIGNSASTTYTVTHNFGTRNVQVQVYGTELSAYAYQTVETDVDRIDANNVVIGFATPPGTNTFTVVVIG